MQFYEDASCNVVVADRLLVWIWQLWWVVSCSSGIIQFHIGPPTCTHRRLQATTSVIADLPACPNLTFHFIYASRACSAVVGRQEPSVLDACSCSITNAKTSAMPLRAPAYFAAVHIYFNLRCKAKQSPVSQETWIPPEYSRPLGQSPSQESLKLATALKPCHNQRNSRYLIFRQKVWSEPNECFRINLPTAGTWLSLSYKYCSYSGWIE